MKPRPFVYDNATREVTVLHPPGATYAYGTAINAATTPAMSVAMPLAPSNQHATSPAAVIAAQTANRKRW
mgnify:CR=1 FL=1